MGVKSGDYFDVSVKPEYDRRGWCRPGLSVGGEVLEGLRASVARISCMRRPEVVYEEDGRTVRALHGCHRYDPVCADLVREPALVDLAETLVGDQVYVYQFKVNIKSPRQGRRWPWHQDFAFWSIEDGMPADDAVNIAISLDAVHADNGPLTVLDGSHRLEPVGAGGSAGSSGSSGSAGDGDDWRRHVSATLSHSLTDEDAAELAGRFPPLTLLGPAGSVTAFHPSIVHSSSDNLSEDQRAMVIITYNAVHNAPTRVHRPEFLVDRDTRPVIRKQPIEIVGRP